MKNEVSCLENQKGFTLIESLVAMVILAIGIFAMYSMQVTSLQGNSRSQVITTASHWAAIQVEDILSRPYEDFIDSGTEDGTDQDGNDDGKDDDGGNFGLDNVTAATADGTFTSPDGFYTVFWNVALDVPITGSKTVRIFVQNNSNIMNNRVVFDYIRQDRI